MPRVLCCLAGNPISGKPITDKPINWKAHNWQAHNWQAHIWLESTSASRPTAGGYPPDAYLGAEAGFHQSKDDPAEHRHCRYRHHQPRQHRPAASAAGRTTTAAAAAAARGRWRKRGRDRSAPALAALSAAATGLRREVAWVGVYSTTTATAAASARLIMTSRWGRCLLRKGVKGECMGGVSSQWHSAWARKGIASPQSGLGAVPPRLYVTLKLHARQSRQGD